MAEQQEVDLSRENSPLNAHTETEDAETVDVSLQNDTDNQATTIDERKRKGEANTHSMMPATKKAHTGSTPDMPPRQIPIHSQIRQFLAPNGVNEERATSDNQAFFINVLLKTKIKPCSIRNFVRGEGLLITRSWLLRARKENNDKLVKKLLELYHHLPMNIEILKESQLGRITRRIKLDYNNDEIKQIASDLVATWSEAVPQMASRASSEPTSVPSTSNNAINMDATMNTTTTKSDTDDAMDTTTQQPGADTSATAEKTSTRRPVITRRTEANIDGAGTSQSTGTSTPSSIQKPEGKQPLISILKQPKEEVFSDGMPELAPVNKKPKKSVRFLPDDQIASILEITIDPNERAYTGRVPDGQGGHMPNPRAMDVAEGKSVFSERNMHLRPTTVWRTPMELRLSKNIQSERERQTLAALYSSSDMMPDSPAEPEDNASPSTEMSVDDVSGTSITPEVIPWTMVEDINTNEDEDEDEEEDDISDVARQFIQLLYNQLPPTTNQASSNATPDTNGTYGLNAHNLAGLLAQNPV
ncbi:hypothetical protein BDF22DRAFT_700548 [Syncephalis plumigaleata]|nr:hypothetical protein BDF22DRAFT_700548 [Syncephalis plumigaleata]